MEQIKIRTFWLKKVDVLWEKSSLVWLYGVRRVGKTYLCRSIQGIEYFDCELPSVRRMLEDPEEFLKGLHGKKIVIDEVHRLDNPSEVLKIATDYFPETKIIATGSSTLGSSAKFRDTLAGRKKNLRLVPMIWQDLADFGNTNLVHRLHHGGLPHLFLSKTVSEHEFQEWMDDSI
jgi:predicted AAA+ superfamily ATPase